MCGRYSLTSDQDEVQGTFDIKSSAFDWVEHVPRYNIAPTQPVLAVVKRDDGNRAEMMRWGLIPWWAKDIKIGNKMINARAESAVEKASFKEAFQRRRCLIVADGFYEWRKHGKDSIPMRVVLKSGGPFSFAGLWERWRSPEGGIIKSCTILTTVANSLIEPVHDRMPVIFGKDAEALWLDAKVSDTAELRELLLPYASGDMEAYEVSPLVNSATYEGPECIEPAARLALPEL